MTRQRIGIFECQSSVATAARAPSEKSERSEAPSLGGARRDGKQVGTQRLDVGRDGLLSTLTQRHEEYHCGYANYNSEERESRTELVGRKGRKRSHKTIDWVHAPTISTARLSFTTRPSSIEMTRSAWAAMSRS